MHIRKINKQAWLIILPLVLFFMYSVSLWVNYNIWYFLGFLIVWILVGGLGVEIGHHRYFSHGHFSCSKWVARLLCFLGNLALNGSAVFWSAVHMGYHHKYADTTLDLHSPVHGKWTSYLGWTLDPDVTNQIDPMFAGKRALYDKWVLAMHKHYYLITYVVFVTVYLISPMFFFLSFIPGIFLAFNQGPIVNVLGHYPNNGYINYEQGNNSRNVTWLSYLTFGLALHNNHHRFPGRINFAVNDNEFDTGYFLIRMLHLNDK